MGLAIERINARKEINKEIWSAVVDNCSKNCDPHEAITVLKKSYNEIYGGVRRIKTNLQKTIHVNNDLVNLIEKVMWYLENNTNKNICIATNYNNALIELLRRGGIKIKCSTCVHPVKSNNLFLMNLKDRRVLEAEIDIAFIDFDDQMDNLDSSNNLKNFNDTYNYISSRFKSKK